MQKQPYPLWYEFASMFGIFIILLQAGWTATICGTLLAIILWYVTGENGYYQGYTRYTCTPTKSELE